MKKIKKIISFVLLISTLCLYGAMAMGSGESSSSSSDWKEFRDEHPEEFYNGYNDWAQKNPEEAYGD